VVGCLRTLFHPKTAFLASAVTVPLFIIAVAIHIVFLSGPSPKSDDPGYRTVHYLLGSIYSGSSTCGILKNDIGSLIAPDLIECSGWGYSLEVRNIKNGCVLSLQEAFEIELVHQSGDEKTFLDTRNSYVFEVKGNMVVDFYEAQSTDIFGERD